MKQAFPFAFMTPKELDEWVREYKAYWKEVLRLALKERIQVGAVGIPRYTLWRMKDGT